MKNKNKEQFLKLVSTENSDTLKRNKEYIQKRSILRHYRRIAIRIHDKLKQLKISKEELSKNTNINIEIINNVLSGKKYIDNEILNKIYKFLNI
jgi:ribosome-binding protein aMBF1 (putative translation factor)